MADSEAKQQQPQPQPPPPSVPIETVRAQDSDGNSTYNNESDNTNDKSLKYLEFVQVAAIYFMLCFSTVYEYAKENSGPLKPGVQTVEATVKTVIGPVYEKFHDVPLELLRFVDRKVDAALSDADGHLPALVKQASSQALMAANRAPEVARAVTAEVRRSGGVVEAAKGVWKQCEPAAEELAVSAWRWLNRLPLFPEVAQLAVPTAAYWSEKYNRVVKYSAESGFPAAAYLPMIPLERIAKVFEERRSEPTETVVMGNGDGTDIAVEQ